jgi:uncharacterized membrane protein
MGFYRQNLFFCNFLLAWLLLFSLLRTAQHFSFATNAWDLSIYDYAMSSTLKGEIMAEPFHGFGWGSHLAVHFTPILFLIVPFYLVFTGPLFLLYIQVLAVGAAALPLYLIAKHEFGNGKMALVVPLIFLLFRPLLNGLMYDFHPEMFFPLFIFASYYFLAVRNRKFPFFLFIVLALWLKEDFAVYTFFYCGWLARSKEWKKTAFQAMLLSAIYILLTMAVFIPFFQGQAQTGRAYEFITKWRDYGQTPVEILKHASAQPLRVLKDLHPLANLARLANYFLPLLFIPLGSSAALLIIPPLLVGWLSRIPAMAAFGLHYGSAVIPFLFLAMLLAMARWPKRADKNRRLHSSAWPWLVLGLLMVNLGNFKWNLFAPAQYRSIREYPAFTRCLALIPDQAPLAAQSVLIPHLPKRKPMSMLPATGQAQFILLHRRLNPWPQTADQLRELDERLQRTAEYRCLFSSGGLRLYEKKAAGAMPGRGGENSKQGPYRH